MLVALEKGESRLSSGSRKGSPVTSPAVSLAANEVSVVNSVNVDPLKAWRTQRLGLMMRAPEHKKLPPIYRKIVSYCVRAHESAEDRKSTRLNSSHHTTSRMPSSA